MNQVHTALLKGVRVLELSRGPSGSYAGRLLSESGAKVTKVILSSKPGSLFKDAKKKVVYLTEEQELLSTVIPLLDQQWDIILWDSHGNCELDQFLTKWSVGKQALSIYVRLDFPDGVNAEEEEAGLQAIGGWMALTGDPERPPLTVGGEPACCLVGAHAAAAGMLALVERAWTARGRFVQVNTLTVIVSALEGAVSNYFSTGHLRGRTGNRHYTLSPMSILPSSDGLVFVGAPVDEQWKLLEGWAGFSHVPEWTTAEGRRKDCAAVENILAGWTKIMSREELFLTGQTFRFPFAKVQSPQELYNCPQLSARHFWSLPEAKPSAVCLPWKAKLNDAGISSSKNHLPPASWRSMRVLDLTSMWSGPYCTRIFADMGAEVIKVEAVHRPDGIRANQDAAPPFFSELNRNKLGIQLDLRFDKDRHTFLSLVRTSDILIENFSPRVMANFGLHPEELWKQNPNLIILSLSAFGQTGPYRNFVGYGPTLESMSGLAALTHYPDGMPWLPGFSISDIAAGIHGAFAAAAALYQQQQQGTSGVRIDLSQYETACQLIGDYLTSGTLPAKPSKLTAARELAEIVKDPRLTIMILPNGSSVLGMPWESPGWKAPVRLPPRLGEHTNQICGSLAKG
ncbi:MAG TPA: CoA transferase [Pseudobacillus sp.]